MQTKVEFFSPQSRKRLLAPGMALAAALLAACAVNPGPKTDAAARPAPPADSAVTSNNGAATTTPAPPAAPQLPPAGETVLRMLAYGDRVRAMSSGELSQETARLGAVQSPAEQMQLALVLSQSRQTAEVIRSQELLTRLLANASAEAQALHPLARLLAARLGEQRRFEDLLDKQSQLARDLQRRLDQTLERLEALKAIERSMTRRPATPAESAPAGRARSPASAP